MMISKYFSLFALTCLLSMPLLAKEKPPSKASSTTPSHFINNDNGTVSDTRNKLMWMRCSLGQSWKKEACEGKAKEFTWKRAMKQSDDWAGYDDWRLPTIKELHTIVYCLKGRRAVDLKNESRSRYVKGDGLNGMCLSDDDTNPRINPVHFPNMPTIYPWFWSSTKYSENKFRAWSIDFANGNDDASSKYNHFYIRLVRNVK